MKLEQDNTQTRWHQRNHNLAAK